MPISPYSGQLYSGYATGRPYTGVSQPSSNYSGSQTSTYSGFKLANSNSSSALRQKPSGKPSFLTGNTAALKKTFSDASVTRIPGDSSVSYQDSSSPYRRYNGTASLSMSSRRDINDNNPERGYNVSRRSNLGEIKEREKRPIFDTSPYLSKYGSYLPSKDEEVKKPKEIDTSKINLSAYSPSNKGTYGEIKRGEAENSSISRNRQVVRLTIKRDKDKDKKNAALQENSVKTIAQKLFEKYTVPDSKLEKRKDDSLPYLPRNKYLATNSLPPEPPQTHDKGHKLSFSKPPIPKENLKREGGQLKSFRKRDDGNEGDDELSDDESEADKQDIYTVAKCYVRATKAASAKKELEHPEEVQDAIVAAVLHPDVDLESDEEIKKLVEEDTDKERSSSKRKNKSKRVKSPEVAKRKKSEVEIGGEIIVDKLKRYVKHQVSIKKESLKNSSRKGSEEKENESQKDKLECKNNDKNDFHRNSSKREDKNLENTSNLNSLTNTNNDKNNDPTNKQNTRPRARIIPITLETDDGDNEHKSYERKRYKTKTIIPDTNLVISPNTQETSERRLSSERTEYSNEGTNKNKCVEQIRSNAVEQTSQTTSRDIPADPFQSSNKVSRERLITHPENKVPETLFIKGSYPEKKNSGKEISSQQKNSVGETEERENSLKEAKNKKFVINDFESREIRTLEDKNKAIFHSGLDDSIKEKSFYPKELVKTKSFYPEELKLDYYQNNEETRTKCSEKKIKLEKPDLEKSSPFTHSDRESKDTKRSSRESNIVDIKDKREILECKLENEEIGAREKDERYQFLVKGMRINSEIKDDQNTTKLEVEIKGGNISSLEDSSSPKPVLAKSKRTFIKNLVDKNSENTSNQIETKPFSLRKSATTQVVQENTNNLSNRKVFNDTESVSSLEFEIKPSLKQFLEDAKSDLSLAENDEEYSIDLDAQSKSEKQETESTQDNPVKKDSLEEPKQDIPTKLEDNAKKPLKRNKIVPNVDEKSQASELQNVRNILKRPLRPKGDPKQQQQQLQQQQQPEKDKIPQEVRPKKVWKKPLPPKDVNQSTPEFTKALNVLKRPGVNKTVINRKEASKAATQNQDTPDETQDETSDVKEDTDNVEKSSITSSNTSSSRKQSVHIEREQTPEKEEKGTEGQNETLVGEKRINERLKQSPKGEDETINEQRESKASENDPIAETRFSKDVSSNQSNRSSRGNKLATTALSKGNNSCGEKNILSTSHSGDSAYGSSPSTPQPRGAVMPEGGKINEEKDEEKEDEERMSGEIKEDNGKCELCGTNCHKKCEKQMANLCGVNQKLLAEALSSVKKGSTADGKDAFRILTTTSTSATKSASSVSSTEGETTTTTTEDEETDTDSSEYNGPAEVRSPIQTRPKFKKYNIEDFNFIKVLGKGSFGKVMLAQQVNTENYFAVKCLKKDVVLEDNDVECCLIERKVLTLGTKHPYLCHLFCSFQTPSHLFFVMEYLTGGDLMFHIQRVGRFDEYRACFYASEIISGLKFLHNKGIIYRDLKLDNILLDYQGHIRIADFGMCKLQIYLDRFADTFCGTPDYMAPEVIKGLHYNQCVDWWSFGVLLYEMMIGKSPFKGCDEDHLFWLICNEEPFYPRFLSREAQSLLKMLLDKDATRRIGPPYSPHGEIKCHNFFKYIDWSRIDRKEMETPYKPKLRHILDVQYFDRSFTKRNAAITPLDDSILETMDQTPFKDFSYTNPNITD